MIYEKTKTSGGHLIDIKQMPQAKRQTEKVDSNLDDDSLFTLFYQMSLDRVQHTRSIYSVWDFLGDVGGLFDML